MAATHLVKMNNNTSRSHLQSLFNNSLAIRQEIQRFESVHPSIYAIYHLIDLLDDSQVASQIRDHVVCIEGTVQTIGLALFVFVLRWHRVDPEIGPAAAVGAAAANASCFRDVNNN